MRFVYVAALCLAVSAAACGGAEKKAEAPASETPASTAATTDAEFGVKECDDYLAKYTECVSSKVPPVMRSAMKLSIDQAKSQWKAAASTPEGRAGLAQACTQAHEAAKASMQAYGCSW